MSAGLLTGLLVVLLGAAVAGAGPASAIDDPTRPDARVTHGPSCRPGGLVVEVVAGTAPYAVRLATTRTPAGEDDAVLRPGESVILRSGDVAYGETINGRLEFTARDGSGAAYTDELEEYSFTRPTLEDCEAASAPTEPHPSPPAPPSSAPAPSSTPQGGAGGDPAPPSGDATATPTPTGEVRPSGPSGAAPVGRPGDGPSGPVAAGDTVTLQASGFLPGELVTVQLHGTGAVLGTATAGPDGTVEVAVRIPDRTEAGRTTVDMVGGESDVVAGVELQVARAESVLPTTGTADLVPLTAAAVALVGAVAGLVSVAGRHRTIGRRPAPIRSA